MFDIAKKHGLNLEQEPEYGGRKYLEKQDFIIAKQKELLAGNEKKLAENEQKISRQESKLEETEKLISEKEQTLEKQEVVIEKKEQELSDKHAELDSVMVRIADVESFAAEVADEAYRKACEVVADTVRSETRKADAAVVEDYKKWVTASERKTPDNMKAFVGRCLDVVLERLRNAAQGIFNEVQSILQEPEIRRANMETVREKAKEFIHERLARSKIEADQINQKRMEQRDTNKMTAKKNREY